ncbi:hypothetical protein BRE01_44350 [Brevibacillus reuszeri]|uniref:Beta-lactamase-related domain-containing protein n=1 Tax=Brevibacillus reuszeri TaxID=54915 RepID=A0ABQ0TS35_9BACL|nr:hypothetical protein [Brevibacillus reuszeri]MED1860380.1 hypothetical protein [Brevibacillus reuszeri]GED70733.1 hypothetical protein BRE01_44350 [Brevibacillus reuszeri]
MSIWKQPPAPELAREVDKKIVALMETFQIVGVSAAVVKENQVVWSNEYGLI